MNTSANHSDNPPLEVDVSIEDFDILDILDRADGPMMHEDLLTKYMEEESTKEGLLDGLTRLTKANLIYSRNTHGQNTKYSISDEGVQALIKHRSQVSDVHAPAIQKISEQTLEPAPRNLGKAIEAVFKPYTNHFAINTGFKNNIIQSVLPDWSQMLMPKWDIPTVNLPESLVNNITANLQLLAQWSPAYSQNFIKTSYVDLVQQLIPEIDKFSEIANSLAWGWGKFLSSCDLDHLRQCMTDEGIPHVFIAPEPICTELHHLESSEERESFILEKSGLIIDYCEKSILLTASAEGQVFATEMIEAFRNNHYISAQSIAGCLIDPLLNEYISTLSNPNSTEATLGALLKQNQAKLMMTRRPEEIKGNQPFEVDLSKRYEDLPLSMFLTIPIFLSACSHYRSGDDLPSSFSRHATVHSGDPSHFTELNALKAIMAVTVALWGLNPVHRQKVEGEQSTSVE